MQIGFQMVNYEDFENMIKKYGYCGHVNKRNFEEVHLNKKTIKQVDLENQDSRLSAYFNSDFVMESDKGDFGKANQEVFKSAGEKRKHLTYIYKTHEVLIIGFLFCRHLKPTRTYVKDGQIHQRPQPTQIECIQEAFWALCNPEQRDYVPVE